MTATAQRRRTKTRNWQVWFVDRPGAAAPRAPLTPLGDGSAPVFRRSGWSSYNQQQWRVGWRAGRGGRLRRPCRPAGRSFSCRAPSLRDNCTITPSALLQTGTMYDAALPLFAEREPVCLATLPPWLDEFGSNDVLFAWPSTAPADVEGTNTPPLPATGGPST